MPVRNTERRLPANFQAADLGQAVASGDSRCTLVSFISNPLVVNRQNTYVLFVTDAGLASATQRYEWRFSLNDNPTQVESTDEGEIAYTPTETGTLNLEVKVLGAGNAEQAAISLSQSVVAPNAELETLISNATGESGPAIGNPVIARELINDHNPYYQAVSLQSPEEGDHFKCFVFNLLNSRAQRAPAARRKQHLDQLAAAINTGLSDYAELAAEGAGVGGIRLALLAMCLDAPPIPWTELPEETGARETAARSLRNRLNELDENVRIDLFNLARFPKSNITLCAKIVEKLRDRYFNGTNFNDVMNGQSGTRGVWITRHFNEGPIHRD
jgi:hypothetical protein